MNRPYLLHGVLPAISAAFCFALMASCIKLAAASLPSIQLVFLRCIFGLCLILPFVLARGSGFVKTSKIKLHVLRSIISVLALNAFFYAVSQIGLAESTLLNSCSPLFIGFLAVLILGEPLQRSSLATLVIGFIGVALILKPGTGLFTLGALLGLASGFFIACTKILIRYMSDTEPVLRTVFYFSLLTSIYSSIPMWWFWVPPPSDAVLLMCVAAMLATAGQLLLTYTFTHNVSVTVAPFSYMIVPLASLLGWLGWQETPDSVSLLGGSLVIISCVIMSVQKNQPNPWKKKPSG